MTPDLMNLIIQILGPTHPLVRRLQESGMLPNATSLTQPQTITQSQPITQQIVPGLSQDRLSWFWKPNAQGLLAPRWPESPPGLFREGGGRGGI